MATAHKAHEQDYIRVRNIDVDCDHTTNETVKRPQTLFDERGEATGTAYEERIDQYSHRNGFRVKWGGKIHTIQPGKAKSYPRYLAEHYAKHLADHMLQKSGKPLNDKMERSHLLNRILEGVIEWHEEEEVDDAELTAREVERRNPGEKRLREEDLGELVEEHVMRDAPEVNPETVEPEEAPSKEESKAGKPSLLDPDNLPSKDDLRAECEAMGIELTGKETQKELATKLRQFA